jgi:hypothetical protein
MSFRIRERDSETDAEWIAEWPFPPRAHFIESRAYDTLMREMDRYVRGEVAGRSFLISGHRGSGKTTLVRLVTDDLTRAILSSAVKRTEQGLRPIVQQRTLSLQRPLLVKLHGPSLFSPVKGKERPELPSNYSPGETGKTAEPVLQGQKEKPVASPPNPRDEQAEDQTKFALEQITIGLYRALTAEFGKSFGNHARGLLGKRRTSSAPDYLEVAGQFTLDLDNAPRPAVLRAYYDRLGRTAAGILWPYQIGKSLLLSGLDDQGIREMVALATAAQAFEVCSGDVTDKLIRKGTASRDDSVETRGEIGLKDIANKAFGIMAGAMVGAGALSMAGLTASIIAGVSTALLSTLVLNWSGKRSNKDERTQDYTFIRRRDRETLERDLPLVIQRVREAGLAPIFLLDELDKLADTANSIAGLIYRLKHLTTDHGFFCFLTDREYYDYVALKLNKEAFPVEHSFFSHRMFILHQPQQLLDYLGRITQNDPGAPAAAGTVAYATASTPIDEAVARFTFGLIVLHRSKLNLIDVLRRLAEECDAQGRVRPSTGKLCSDRGYRFEASIQLVIGLILRRAAIRERIDHESRFMQRAIDALYILSRAWEEEAAIVRLDRVAIVKCLLERNGNDAAIAYAWGAVAVGSSHGAASAKGTRKGVKKASKPTVLAAKPEEELKTEGARNAEAELLRTGMSRRDLDLVVDAVSLLADLLSDVTRLRSWLAVELGSDEEHEHLRAIVPPGNLIECISTDRREYRFVADTYGQDIETRTAVQAAQAAASQSHPLAADAVHEASAEGDAALSPDAAPEMRLPEAAVAGQDTEAAPPPTDLSVAVNGNDLPTVASEREVSAVPESEPLSASSKSLPEQVDEALAYLMHFDSVLSVTGVSLLDLVRLQILPPTFDPGELASASERLEEAQGQLYEGLSKDLPLVWSLAAFIRDNGTALAILFRMAIHLARDARQPPLRLAAAIEAVTRCIDLRMIFPGSSRTAGTSAWAVISHLPFSFDSPDEPMIIPSDDPGSVECWRQQLTGWILTRTGRHPGFPTILQLWDAAAGHVEAHLIKGVSVIDPLPYANIVYAAAGEPPADLLRRDLRKMTVAEWSDFGLLAFPRKTNEADHGTRTGQDRTGPYWAFLAGLRALGFDRDVLIDATAHHSDGLAKPLINRLIDTAPDTSAAGFVLVMRSGGVSAADASDHRRRRFGQGPGIPCVAISEIKLQTYGQALEWLVSRGRVTRLVYEVEDLDFNERAVPQSLQHLPRYAFTSMRPSTREQAARTDIAYEVRTIDDLTRAMAVGFSEPTLNDAVRGKSQ